MAQAPTYSFLEEQVLAALQRHGFDKLTDEDKKTFLPQFMAEAERRLGIALAPYLQDAKAVAEFNSLLTTEATAEAMLAFWKKQVPDFEQVVGRTIESFSEELGLAFKM